MKATRILLLTTGIIISGILSCRHDSPAEAPRIRKLIFEESVKSIYIGDVVNVKINVEPLNAKQNDKITYKASKKGIIAIKQESTNDAVVFEGVTAGKTVITATVNGVSDFLNVEVLGSNVGIIPHIIVPSMVMELKENERRSIVASLAGGNQADESNFVWSYSNQNIIKLESSNNVGVIDTLNIGESVVTISHPKAQFSVNVLVFVSGIDEYPVYITTVDNIIAMKTTDHNYEYRVELHGGTSADYHDFEHTIIEGEDTISLLSNNNIGTVNPLKRGVARIALHHPKAKYDAEIIIVVNEDFNYKYIDVDKNLVLMNEEGYDFVSLNMAGNVPQDYARFFTVTVDNEDVISIYKSDTVINITGKKKGRAIITVKNPYADFDRQILVVVNGYGDITDEETYIATNQNVITMEVGDDKVLLTMTLVGGNEADKNNFTWTVDDSSVISAESGHGKVRYADIPETMRAIAVKEHKFEAQAAIKAKKVGTARITLENPKSKNSLSVIVKVYKKGTFGAVPAVLDGQPVYFVQVNKPYPVQLQVVSGTLQNESAITWKTEPENRADVSGTGLTGVITGKQPGITTLKVKGSNFRSEFQALVVVAPEDNWDTISYMYAYRPYISVIKGESFAFSVICENMTKQDIANIKVSNKNPEFIEVLSHLNNIVVTGIALGEAEIVISADGINTVTIKIMVEDYKINPEKPYYLRPEKYIYGLVSGGNLTLPVELTGGKPADEKNIIWKTENSAVVTCTGNGKACLVAAQSVGQTLLTISHPQSINELEIVIYVAEDQTSLANKIILYVKEKNVLLFTEETKYITVITNADDTQKMSIQWDIPNYNIIDAKISGDNTKAIIYGKNPGTMNIKVKHPANPAGEIIYISVIEEHGRLTTNYINVPSIVEMVKGDIYTIQAVTNNYFNQGGISWELQNNAIATIHGNGDTCMVQAIISGSGVIKVRCTDLGFEKNILLFIYESVNDMMNYYTMAGENSRYVINEGDTINVGLMFGLKGFPEHELLNIHWRTQESNIIGITENGKNASIRGIAAGIAQLTVSSAIANTVTIEVEVRSIAKAGNYRLVIKESDRIKGIVTGSYADIDIKIYNGGNEVYNMSGIQYQVENSEIISITDNKGSIRVHTNAHKEGQSYIYIRHDLIEEARILIYTAFDQTALDGIYPLTLDKNNYLLKKGTTTLLKIYAKDNDVTKHQNIHYYLEKNNGVLSINEKNKLELNVTAQKAGNEVILVNYNSQTVQRIYISVTEGLEGLNGTYVVTENIIGLVAGKKYETSVSTNSTDDIEVFFNENSNVFDVISCVKNKIVIIAYEPGVTTMTIRVGTLERTLLVFSCAHETELRNYQAANIDQRYFRLQKNESLPLSIYSYQGKAEGATTYADYYGYSDQYGNVIELTNIENGKCMIKGLNEGRAAIRVTNNYYKLDIVVYVEVENFGSGGSMGIANNSFISAYKTLYIIEMEDQNVLLDVYVSGNYSGTMRDWKWQGYDNSIISLDYMGSSATVNPKKNGTTEILVSNGQSRPLTVTVIVGKRFNYDANPVPYIYIEQDIYEIVKGTGNLTVSYDILNVAAINPGFIRFNVSNNNVSVTHNANQKAFVITPQNSGMSYISISYNDSQNKLSLNKDIYILVKDNIYANTVFLTTSDNYIIAETGELRTINVKLANYDETDPFKYTWKVKSGSNVVQVVGNGTFGQIYGINTGEAVITVSHEKAMPYDLNINVKIVQSTAKKDVIYLTTRQNVIETVTGNTEYLYVQKIGGNIALNRCTWSVSDSSIVSLNGNSYELQITALKKGQVKVTVYNEENSAYKLDIVIVVRDAVHSEKYIDTPQRLIVMAPGDTQRIIKVSLVNGNDSDKTFFVWSMQSQVPSNTDVAAAGGKVISYSGNNDECFINPLNEGIARIRVEHRSANGQPLFITVYVTSYEAIDFALKYKDIIAGDNEFIGINLPTYEDMRDKVVVWAENIDNPGQPSPCDVYYTNQTVLLCGREAGNAVVKARIIGKDDIAELYVRVIKEIPPNTNYMLINQSLYNLSMKSERTVIKAQILGQNIIDSDNDAIEWVVSKSGIIDIVPASLKGREIQIKPKKLGELYLTVKHSKADPKYWKTINIIVGDPNNAFSVSKENVVIQNRIAQEVSCNILGGTTRDYSEVIWIAEMKKNWDGTFLEIVRIMGHGQTVLLYPINDGETTVRALYKNTSLSITVSVVNDYYFDFRNQNERMYPGEERDLYYDVKPANSNVNWLNTGTSDVITYGDVQGSGPGENGISTRYLHVKALREGTDTIIGMANNHVGRVNVVVAWDYSFVLMTANKSSQPFDSRLNKEDSTKYTGIITVNYEVYPPDTYIKCASNLPDGMTVTINDPVLDTAGGKGKGVITIFSKTEYYGIITFEQYKKKENLASPEVKTGITQVITITYLYPQENQTDLEPSIIFIRQDGFYSNRQFQTNKFNKPASKQSHDGLITGEKLFSSSYSNPNLEDTLYVGDGETHYLLLDKKFENAYMEIDSIEITGRTSPSNNYGTLEFKKINLQNSGGLGGMAIEINGGPDYIDYNRVKIAGEVYLDVKSEHGQNTVTITYEPYYNKTYSNVFINELGRAVTIYRYLKSTVNNNEILAGIFDQGEFVESYKNYISDYNTSYYYSTNEYKKTIETTQTKNNNDETISIYNLIKNTYDAGQIEVYFFNIGYYDLLTALSEKYGYNGMNIGFTDNNKIAVAYNYAGDIKNGQAYNPSCAPLQFAVPCDNNIFTPRKIKFGGLDSSSGIGVTGLSIYSGTNWPNPNGPNIFGEFYDASGYGFANSNIWGDNQWSHEYYLSDACGQYGDHKTIYGKQYAQQRLRFKPYDGTIVVPYYWFNRWPLRYEPLKDNNDQIIVPWEVTNNFGTYGRIYRPPEGTSSSNYAQTRFDPQKKYNILSMVEHLEGKPMPSIDQGNITPNDKMKMIIKYKRYGYNNGVIGINTYEKTINVEFQVRKCSAFYQPVNYTNGDNDKKYHYITAGEITEIQGPLQSFYDDVTQEPYKSNKFFSQKDAYNKNIWEKYKEYVMPPQYRED